MEIKKALFLGLLGCLCFGGGDWLMIYGDTAYNGNDNWLTEGVAAIAPWRLTLAMGLAFPGILFYGAALFAIEKFILEEKDRKRYHYLTAFGITPWMMLHLFYIMILYVFAWMNQNGYEEVAISAAEALYGYFSWVVIISEAMMLLPFFYWFYLQFTHKTVFPKMMAFTNVLIIYAVMYFIKTLLPDSPFRIGFTNGLMSESMAIWFVTLMIGMKFLV